MAGNVGVLDNARRLVEGFVEHYNSVRLNRANGNNTPADMLAGRRRRFMPRGIDG